MARKNIYIRDEDLPLFDRAEKLGLENFSAFVAEALKKYVKIKDAETAGLEEHTLQINNPEQGERTIRFVGRLLAGDRRLRGQTSDRKDRWTDWEIYQTKGGKIVVYRESGSAWQGEEGCVSEYITLDALPGYDDEVFVGGEPVPGSLLEEAAGEIGEERIKWID